MKLNTRIKREKLAEERRGHGIRMLTMLPLARFGFARRLFDVPCRELRDRARKSTTSKSQFKRQSGRGFGRMRSDHLQSGAGA